ncbi:EAL domain-containing protein [Nisaea acidiphila]|uniref:EAL domain-containing protein n=1 Tax=Nisaea acidiphila TaxID=1862145 RepID=A0A9J7AWB3_9PROT|nr:EAL domain-containing protein [Nisaea acidiphila]UUX51647.1 EAL domain-containing protein [Nisaea acidiphila]
MRCQECEHVDEIIFGRTRFWFYMPTSESHARVASVFGRREIGSSDLGGNCIEATVERDDVDGVLTALFGELNKKELKETRVLSTAGADPTPLDMMRVMSADVFVNRVKGQWLVEAIEEELYDTWYQPIVDARSPSSENPFALEGLFRMRDKDGNSISPGYVFSLAEHAGLLFSLDIVARACAVRRAAESGYRGRIFVNFNPSSIYDPAYCLRTTASAVAELGLKPADITFELTETHRIQDKDHLKGILAFYRQAGFKVALDDIGSGWSGLNLLHEMRPDFVKIDMDLVRNIDRDPLKQSIVGHLISIAKEHSIEVIAEGVETEAEAGLLRDAGADYLQGYLFAKPAPIDTFLGSPAAA